MEWTSRFITRSQVIFRRLWIHDDLERGDFSFCQPTIPSNV